MKKIINIIYLLLGVFVLSSCTASKQDNNNKIIYVNNIEFLVSNNTITNYIGDTIKIDGGILRLSPWNANAFYVVFSQHDQSVASYDSDKKTITSLQQGSVNVVIKAYKNESDYSSHSFVLNVLQRPIYAQAFSSSNIVEYNINIDEHINILPNVMVSLNNDSNDEVSLNAFDQNYLITVAPSTADIITYNSVSGIVIPQKQGVGYLIVKVQKNENNYIEQVIKINVTENYYVQSFTINNLETQTNENNEQVAHITLLQGQSINLEYTFETYNNMPYNMPINLVRNSENYVIDDLGNITATTESNNNHLQVVVQSGANSYISINIYVKIIPMLDLNITLLDQNQNEVSEVFEGNNYILKVQSNVTFTTTDMHTMLTSATLKNAELQVEGDHFLATFYLNDMTNGAYTNIKLNYTQNSFNSAKTFYSNELVLPLYSKVLDYSIIYSTNNGSVNFNNNIANLELINMATIGQNGDFAHYYANFSIITLGNAVIKENNYNLYVQNNGLLVLLSEFMTYNNTIEKISENTYRYTPTFAENLNIIIQDKQSDFTKTIQFFTTESMVESVVLMNNSVQVNDITLYVNGDNNSFNISNFLIEPFYAYDNELTYVVHDQGVAQVLQNTIIAVGFGNTTLSVYHGQKLLNEFNINVVAYPNNFYIYSNNALLAVNNFKLDVYVKGANYNVVLHSYYYDNRINNTNYTFEYLNENNEVITISQIINANNEYNFWDRFTFTTLNYGCQKVRFYYQNVAIGVITINVYEEILTASYENTTSDITLNLYYDTDYTFINKIMVNDNSSYYNKEHIIFYNYTNTPFVTVTNEGEVVIDSAIMQSFSNLTIVEIRTQVITKNGNLTLSYFINLIYNRPYDNISTLSFERAELSVVTNEDFFVENALFVSTSKIDNYYNENDIIFSSSNPALISQISFSGVTLSSEIFNIVVQAQVIIYSTATYGDTQVVASFVLTIINTPQYDQITSLSVQNAQINANIVSQNVVTIENLLIINGGQAGNYDLSEIIITNSQNAVTNILNGVVSFKTNFIGQIIVTLSLVSNSQVTCEFVVNTYMELNNESNFSAIMENGNYILTSNITLPTDYQTISNFSGVINGNGYSIYNLNKPLFSTLHSSAKIYNLTLNIAILTSKITATTFGALATTNLGEIDNIKLYGTINIDESVAHKIGAIVYTNGATSYTSVAKITNSVVYVTIKTINGSTVKNEVGTIAHTNIGVINNCSVGYIDEQTATMYRTQVENIIYVGGAVYTNNNTVTNTHVYINVKIKNDIKLFAAGLVFSDRATTVNDTVTQPDTRGSLTNVNYFIYGNNANNYDYSRLHSYIASLSANSIVDSVINEAMQTYYNDILR